MNERYSARPSSEPGRQNIWQVVDLEYSHAPTEPYPVYPICHEKEARRIAARLNAGQEVFWKGQRW